MKIEFISYTGKYPNLCSGVLTVKIDGKKYKFGHETGDYDFEKRCYKNNNFDDFWQSGGSVRRNEDWDMWAEQDEWQLSCYDWEKADENHPQWIIDILPKLIKLFNDNVPYGCCGGCI